MKGQLLYKVSKNSICGLGKDVNQDSVCSGEKGGACIAILCDGTGGGVKSEEAAKYASTSLRHWFENVDHGACPRDLVECLREELRKVNRDIFARSRLANGRNYQSTTASVVYLSQDNAVILWVGDSRIYLIRRDIISQVSIDHTIFDQSQLSNSALSSSLGRNEDIPQIGVEILSLKMGDFLLMVSDGVSDVLTEGEILENSRNGVDVLIKAAADGSNFDDCSAIAIQINSG